MHKINVNSVAVSFADSSTLHGAFQCLFIIMLYILVYDIVLVVVLLKLGKLFATRP